MNIDEDDFYTFLDKQYSSPEIKKNYGEALPNPALLKMKLLSVLIASIFLIHS